MNVIPTAALPSQFANKDGSFNWWGFAIVGLSVAVMTFQIIDIMRSWKVAQLEREQEKKINKMQTQLTELATLHQNEMPSLKEAKTFVPEIPKFTTPLKEIPIRFGLQGFSA